MDKVFTSVYAFGGLIVVFGTAAQIFDFVRGKEDIHVRCFSEKWLVFYTAMAIFVPVFWYVSNFVGVIPDGTYQKIVSVQMSDRSKSYYRPADISIYTDVGYEDFGYYFGAVERESHHAIVDKYVFLEKIYWTDDQAEHSDFIDKEVKPGVDTEVESSSGEIYFVNIGEITQDAVGVTTDDLWNRLSLYAKIEPFLITICCLFNVFQYLLGKPKEFA